MEDGLERAHVTDKPFGQLGLGVGGFEGLGAAEDNPLHIQNGGKFRTSRIMWHNIETTYSCLKSNPSRMSPKKAPRKQVVIMAISCIFFFVNVECRCSRLLSMQSEKELVIGACGSDYYSLRDEINSRGKVAQKQTFKFSNVRIFQYFAVYIYLTTVPLGKLIARFPSSL